MTLRDATPDDLDAIAERLITPDSRSSSTLAAASAVDPLRSAGQSPFYLATGSMKLPTGCRNLPLRVES